MSIKLDLKVFLFAILFVLTRQIEIYSIIMIFALIHEIGHLMAGLTLGFKPKSIGINPFGFQIEFKTFVEDFNKKVKNGNELCIKKAITALAGPLTNLFIVLILCFNNTQYTIEKEIVIYANIIIGLFNLIPIYPLDGGRILKEIMHIKLGLRETYKVVHIISKITIILLTIISSIVILYIHNIDIVLIIAYLWYLVAMENKAYKIKNKAYENVFTSL